MSTSVNGVNEKPTFNDKADTRAAELAASPETQALRYAAEAHMAGNVGLDADHRKQFIRTEEIVSETKDYRITRYGDGTIRKDNIAPYRKPMSLNPRPSSRRQPDEGQYNAAPHADRAAKDGVTLASERPTHSSKNKWNDLEDVKSN